MPFTLASLRDLLALPFDDVIDVRSPAEFAEDHVPGAINLPVLSNEQRAQVGTMYVQDSPFKARKLGAALVARNAAHHLETELADREGAWRPLLYCWRGGQRSGSFASILSQIGWRAEVLEGGYQSYRRAVVSALYDTPLPHRFVLLDGNTGTAKTDLLHRVAGLGAQILDLEGLAHHRGSVLGPRPEGQPAQKGFESALVAAISGLDPARPVLVEAESSKVGNLSLPPQIWATMRAAPRISLTASLDDRAIYLVSAYADLISDLDQLLPLLSLLAPFVGHERVALWKGMASSGAHVALARDLMERHYDLRYTKGRPEFVSCGELDITLDDDGLTRASARIAEILSRI